MDADKVDRDKVFELEDASTTEEVPNHVATLNSALCQKLLDLSAPKLFLSMTSVKSMCMEQVLLLVKMDVRILIKKPEYKCNYFTHEQKCCGCLMKSPWKVKGSYKNEERRSGSHSAAHADRHLENMKWNRP